MNANELLRVTVAAMNGLPDGTRVSIGYWFDADAPGMPRDKPLDDIASGQRPAFNAIVGASLGEWRAMITAKD